MSITSVSFLFFLLIVIIGYYSIPIKRYQWVWLLAVSIFFYLCTGIGNVIYILCTALSTYLATRIMERVKEKTRQYLITHKESLTKQEKKIVRQKCTSKRKCVMIVTLFFNFGILCTFKYLSFFLAQINAINNFFSLETINYTTSLIIPLGISFYTFQTMGYLIDVYWEKVDAEHNFAKLLLFVSFFPQITQGPISNYQQLSTELYGQHNFEYKNYSYGCQRMLWGFYKKMVIADLLAPFVKEAFLHYSEYAGISILVCAFMYSIQIYADFSGYMDIVCGFSEILGIHLTENFERPYFSKSIADYWRRWHISLGEWFKTYIYYPIAVAKWNRNLGKYFESKCEISVVRTLPATIALVVTWFTTGLWHGANWRYIAWGLLNGFFLILSLWMEPIYEKVKIKFSINENKKTWTCFQIIRTFILVTLIKVLPEVGTLNDGLRFIKQIFTNHSIPKSLSEFIPGYQGINDLANLLVIFMGTCLIFLVSIIQRKRKVRDYLQSIPRIWRWMIFIVLALLILVFGTGAAEESFMYAQF